MLPLDVLPHVLGQLEWRVGDLAACCCVSRAWRRFATPFLYERIWLRSHQRLVRVFATLAAHPELARLVRILAEKLEALEAQIEAALLHMTHLESLHWTRTGSLTDRLVLSIFANMKCLRTLEVTGDSRFYSPRLLADNVPRTVTRLAVVLPDRTFGACIVRMAETLPLESFSIVALQSSVVTDDMLAHIAPHVRGLRRLVLAGCKAVRGAGVLEILRSAAVSELSLEGLAISVDMLAALSTHLDSLQSLTLTHPPGNGDAFFGVLEGIVNRIPLQRLVLYAVGGSPPVLAGERSDDRVLALPGPNAQPHAGQDTSANPALTTSFVKRLVFGRSSRLRMLRVHGIAMSLYQLQMISCSTLSDTLEDMVVHLYDGDFDMLAASVLRCRSLRLLHVQSHLRSDAHFSEDQFAELAAEASSLRYLGYRNRMWHVVDGALYPWDMSAGVIPETMMLVRV